MYRKFATIKFRGTETLVSINPATDKVLNTYTAMSDKEVCQILNKSQVAAGGWARTEFGVRRHLMTKLADLLQASKSELAKLMAAEMGKPIAQGIAEVEKCAWVCKYYVENGKFFLVDEELEHGEKQCKRAYRPLGTILGVMPWNFPFWQVFRFAVPNLIAGNVVVLKHASNVSGCALAIERLFLDVGFPTGVFKTLLITSRSVPAVVANPIVKGVAVTGSIETGRSVASEASKHIKKSVLELGGSDAYIVLADADIEKAAEACVESRLTNAGQSCISATRFIVVKEIHTQFFERVYSKMAGKVAGDPLHPGVDIGPLASKAQRRKLHKQVESSIAKGATLHLGGTIPSKTGAFYKPTLLSQVTRGMPAYDEELFGPVASIIQAEDEQEAIAIANGTELGLGAAVFTSDLDKGLRIASEQLEAGVCFVNDFVKSDPRLPFGGIKHSGYGRELSRLGIREFLNPKTVVLA